MDFLSQYAVAIWEGGVVVIMIFCLIMGFIGLGRSDKKERDRDTLD